MSYIIYMIGTSGSGKTTLANALEERLIKKGVKKLQVIDGDIIREQLGNMFGYTYEERMKCNQVVRIVVQYLLENNISVILTQVAAYEEMRRKMREHFKEKYIEIYVKCSYEECAKRDVKGYYKKQKEGLIENLNGAGDIYEVPLNSNLIIDTEKESVDSAVDKILEYLTYEGIILE